MEGAEISRLIHRAPWAASRTYLHESGESLSVITNARTHQFITMEAEAALLWQRIEEGILLSDLQHRARSMGVAGELDAFVSNLDEAQLITPETDSRETAFVQADVPPDPSVDPDEPGLRAYEQAELKVQRWVVEHEARPDPELETFPIVDGDRFFPKWVSLNHDARGWSGDFGYATSGMVQ